MLIIFVPMNVYIYTLEEYLELMGDFDLA